MRNLTQTDTPTLHDAARIARLMTAWHKKHARDLPWRQAGAPGHRDAYQTLVSEFMLQQTQVDRVVPLYHAFLARFPTISALAASDQQQVLALWSGLGYYRRAIHLHKAAIAILEQFSGAIPHSHKDLLSLPGVGQYTAAAIACLAHNSRDPIIDGNVTRVALRILSCDQPPQLSLTKAAVTDFVSSIMLSARDPAMVGEGFMELGAVICTPKAPSCHACPLADSCSAHGQGLVDQIPKPNIKPAKRNLYCDSLIIKDAADAILIEQRPDSGLWANLWQTPTIERSDQHAARQELADLFDSCPVSVSRCSLAKFEHQTTHRRVFFRVFTSNLPRSIDPESLLGTGPVTRRWIDPLEIDTVGISNAQRRIICILGHNAARSLS